MIQLFTIGFTQKTAETFFNLLLGAGVQRVIDTRLNNRSQLAGFSKADDLRYFLKAIGNIVYTHNLLMAPTQELLDRYKKLRGSWAEYEDDFRRLIAERELASKISASDLDHACLLCSEHQPNQCHRRLVAEYFQAHFSDLRIVHLE